MLCEEQMKLGRSCSMGNSGKLNSFSKPPETSFSVCGSELLFAMIWIPKTSDTPTVRCKYRTHPSQGCWESWPLSIQGYSPRTRLPSTRAVSCLRYRLQMPHTSPQSTSLEPLSIIHVTRLSGRRKKEEDTSIFANLSKSSRLLGTLPDTPSFWSCETFQKDGWGWHAFL